MPMYKVMSLIAFAFLSFIFWVIYLANTGQGSIFFNFVAAIPYGDKLGHFCLFGVLTFLVNTASKFKSKTLLNIDVYYGSVGVLIFVLLEELSQYFIPNRTLDASDFIASVIGVLAFTVITTYYANKLKGKH